MIPVALSVPLVPAPLRVAWSEPYEPREPDWLVATVEWDFDLSDWLDARTQPRGKIEGGRLV